MRHFRAVFRLFLISLVTFVLYLFGIVGRLVVFRSSHCKHNLRAGIVRTWALVVAWIIGMKRTVKGTPPSPPFCLVANHLSYIDILLFLTEVKGVLISRADVRNWRVIGRLAHFAGTLFIDRSLGRDVVRVNDIISGILEKGEGVIFFPEATSTRGSEVGRFKSSLLEFPARSGFPIHYASLSYNTLPGDPRASDVICWWGDMTFGAHFYSLLTLSRFEALIHFGEAPVSVSDRKELATKLRNRVAENFIQVT